jgi:ubiquinone/menaquinone biosynthesis C-methylase UbiE
VHRQTDALELLDGPLDDPAALAGNLRDLRRINRLLGGVRLTADAIEALAAHREDLSLLDVGTGGADIPMALLDRARRRGRRLSVVAVDNRPEILAAAAIAWPRVPITDGLELHVGDGLSLPYPDRSFDVAHASLVVHHLEPTDATALLAEMARVARLGVIVNDVDRRWPALVGAWLMGHFLTGNRYTRHDAPLSVRRGYRPSEVDELLRSAGLTPVRHGRGPFGRYAIAAVHAPVVDVGKAGEPAAPDPVGAGE